MAYTQVVSTDSNSRFGVTTNRPFVRENNDNSVCENTSIPVTGTFVANVYQYDSKGRLKTQAYKVTTQDCKITKIRPYDDFCGATFKSFFLEKIGRKDTTEAMLKEYIIIRTHSLGRVGKTIWHKVESYLGIILFNNQLYSGRITNRKFFHSRAVLCAGARAPVVGLHGFWQEKIYDI